MKLNYKISWTFHKTDISIVEEPNIHGDILKADIIHYKLWMRIL